MTLGEKIKESREKKGLSIRAVAKEAGVSDSYLSKIERDLKVPSIDFMVKIGRVLDEGFIGYHMAILNNAENKMLNKLLEFYMESYNIDLDGVYIKNIGFGGDCRISDLKDKISKTIKDRLLEISQEDNKTNTSLENEIEE